MFNYNLQTSNCAITFDGHRLDHEIEGYHTVNVEGRQLFSPSLHTVEIPGRVGDLVLGESYGARTIRVHFLMRDHFNRYYLANIKRLTEILQTEDEAPFSFADEDGVRFGRLSGFEDPPYDSNVGVGVFELYCSSPYLYSDLRTARNKVPRLKYPKYKVRIDEIKVALSGSSSKVVIKNATQGKNIVLNGDFKSGDKIVISSDTITVNEQNRLSWLDYVTSEYHNFDVYSDDVLICSPQSDVVITYRECVL